MKSYRLWLAKRVMQGKWAPCSHETRDDLMERLVCQALEDALLPGEQAGHE